MNCATRRCCILEQKHTDVSTVPLAIIVYYSGASVVCGIVHVDVRNVWIYYRVIGYHFSKEDF